MPADNQINAEEVEQDLLIFFIPLNADKRSQCCGNCLHFQFWFFNFEGMPMDALSKGPYSDPICDEFFHRAVPWTRGKVAGMQKHIDLFKRVPGLSSPSFTWPPFGARSKWGPFCCCCCSGGLGTMFSESPWGSHCTASLRRARMGGASMEALWVWGISKISGRCRWLWWLLHQEKGSQIDLFWPASNGIWLPKIFHTIFFLFCEEK